MCPDKWIVLRLPWIQKSKSTHVQDFHGKEPGTKQAQQAHPRVCSQQQLLTLLQASRLQLAVTWPRHPKFEWNHLHSCFSPQAQLLFWTFTSNNNISCLCSGIQNGAVPRAQLYTSVVDSQNGRDQPCSLSEHVKGMLKATSTSCQPLGSPPTAQCGKHEEMLKLIYGFVSLILWQCLWDESGDQLALKKMLSSVRKTHSG